LKLFVCFLYCVWKRHCCKLQI